MMERITITLPKQMLDRIDELVDSGRYAGRSEVIREALRRFFDEVQHS